MSEADPFLPTVADCNAMIAELSDVDRQAALAFKACFAAHRLALEVERLTTERNALQNTVSVLEFGTEVSGRRLSELVDDARAELAALAARLAAAPRLSMTMSPTTHDQPAQLVISNLDPLDLTAGETVVFRLVKE